MLRRGSRSLIHSISDTTHLNFEQHLRRIRNCSFHLGDMSSRGAPKGVYQSLSSNPGGGGGGGTQQVLYGEALPLGPNPYPFMYHF